MNYSELHAPGYRNMKVSAGYLPHGFTCPGPMLIHAHSTERERDIYIYISVCVHMPNSPFLYYASVHENHKFIIVSFVIYTFND